MCNFISATWTLFWSLGPVCDATSAERMETRESAWRLMHNFVANTTFKLFAHCCLIFLLFFSLLFHFFFIRIDFLFGKIFKDDKNKSDDFVGRNLILFLENMDFVAINYWQIFSFANNCLVNECTVAWRVFYLNNHLAVITECLF